MNEVIKPKITGYRELSQEELALINEGKALAEQCGRYIARLRQHDGKIKFDEGGNRIESTLILDQRWISIGATDLQLGFMAVTRGIAQPTTF